MTTIPSSPQQSSQPSSQRPAPYAIDATSLGWLIVGASAVADQFAIEAIRHQAPLAASQTVNSWITGVYSHHAGRGQQFAVKHHIPHSSDDLPALLYRDYVQCVYVANHPRHHFESVRAALSAGKHVLCEPPLALMIDEAQLLSEIATRSGLLLGVNFSHRGDPVVADLKSILQKEQIGELIGGRLLNPLLLETRQRTWRLQENVGGALLHRTLFSVDLLRFLLGDEISVIQAHSGVRVHTENLDEDIHSSLRFRRSNLTITAHDSFLIPHAASHLELFGTNGTVSLLHCLSLPTPSELSILPQDRHPQSLSPSTSLVGNQRFVNTFAAFNHAVRNHGQPLATAQDFMAALQIIEAARQVLQRDHWKVI